MSELYVICNRFNGSLVTKFKKVPIQFERNAFWKEPVWTYPSKKKPICYNSKEEAEKDRKEMSPNGGTYVRKANDKIKKKWGILK